MAMLSIILAASMGYLGCTQMAVAALFVAATGFLLAVYYIFAIMFVGFFYVGIQIYIVVLAHWRVYMHHHDQ